MKYFLGLFVTLFLFVIHTSSALAVSVSISNVPSSIGSEEFEFNTKVEGAQSGTNYLRVSFSEIDPTTKKSKSNYFGYTFNGSEFYNGSEVNKYLPVSIGSTGVWEGKIKTKIDAADSSFKGAGNYIVKIRRYTESGSSYIWSNESNISINYSSTPSSAPAGSPTSSYTNTSIASSLFVVENVPTSISSDQSFNVKVNLINQNSKNSKFYIKGAFVKKGESNYFGYTKVNGSNVKNSSSYSSQREITTDSNGSWTGELEVQPDSLDSGFKGTGEYGLKVGRYTESGSGPAWSNESTININAVSVPPAPETKSTIKPSPSSENSESVLGVEDEDFESSVAGTLSKEVKKNIKIPEIKGISTKKEEVKIAGEKSNSLDHNFIYMIIGFIILVSGVGIFVYKIKKQGGFRKIDI